MASDKEDNNVIQVQFGGSRNSKPKEAEAAPASTGIVESLPTPEDRRKLEVFKEALDHGTVLVMFDARPDDVLVPPQFKKEVNLSLNFDYRYNIPDFEFNEHRVAASLSFSGNIFYCSVPWGRVYGIRAPNETAPTIFPKSIPQP